MLGAKLVTLEGPSSGTRQPYGAPQKSVEIFTLHVFAVRLPAQKDTRPHSSISCPPQTPTKSLPQNPPHTHNGQNSKAQEEAYRLPHLSHLPTPPNTHPEAAPHSRAARRAASPSLPIALPPRARSSSPKPSEAKPHILSAQNAGIRKKNTKMTRAQRVRAEKAMERAADDMDKWEKKKAKSIEKARGIKDRAKVWDDINGESGKVVKKGKGAFAGLEDEGDELDKNGKSVWVDVKEGDAEMDEVVGQENEEKVETVAPAEEDELL